MQPMILQSDFGYADGAVCAMYGVAENVCPELRVSTSRTISLSMISGRPATA